MYFALLLFSYFSALFIDTNVDLGDSCQSWMTVIWGSTKWRTKNSLQDCRDSTSQAIGPNFRRYECRYWGASVGRLLKTALTFEGRTREKVCQTCNQRAIMGTNDQIFRSQISDVTCDAYDAAPASPSLKFELNNIPIPNLQLPHCLVLLPLQRCQFYSVLVRWLRRG